jgi:hypothetical protein
LAALGRWVSRDPMEERDNVLHYAYVSNSPQSFADAVGLWKIGFFGWAGHENITNAAFDTIDCRLSCDECDATTLTYESGNGWSSDPGDIRAELFEGLVEGVAWPDRPDGWATLGSVMLFGLSHNSTTYHSHFAGLQYWHSMANGETSASEVVHKILSQASVWLRDAENTTSCRERGLALGKLLHMVQDSYSRSHVTRAGALITRFQDYNSQDDSKHGVADKEVGSSEYQSAIQSTRDILNLALCRKASVGDIMIFLKDKVYSLHPEAEVNGSALEFKK